MNRYPPLKALLAFDATMRTNSFSLAAEALCVTPGAVGQQIQKLEEWLGVPLFIRQVRQIVPTDEAKAYWQKIQPALAQIADASQKLRDSSSRVVWLSMPPSFATKWFTARMARLLTQHPGIELHLNISPVPVDFERESIDLAIRYFDGQAANLDATLLLDDEARVYGSPEYIARLGLHTPRDLLRATLLAITIHPEWERWLQQFGELQARQIATIPRIHFDQALMAIEAARLGQGMVMTSKVLVDAELAAGTLVEPFAACYLPMTNGYYLVHHNKLVLRSVAMQLKEWLLEEAKTES